MSEKYNGWSNYQTWKLALNISNDEGFYKESRELVKKGEIVSGQGLKEWLEGIITYSEEFNTWKICDTWSNAEWSEINFEEVFDNIKQEE